MENQFSMLPQPKARSFNIAGALTENSESDNNIRNAMPPPGTTSLKRQASNLPEPAAKRKTLVERAGEPLKSISNPSRSLDESSHYGQPHNAFSSYRNFTSSSSNGSMRGTSNHSRATSASSMTGSIGHSGIKPPSLHPGAGKFFTSMGRGPGIKQNTKPNTVYASYNGSHEILKDKSKDPHPSTLMTVRGLNPKHSFDSQVLCKTRAIRFRAECGSRKTSLSTAFQDLRIQLDVGSSFFPKSKQSLSRTISPSRLPRPVTPLNDVIISPSKIPSMTTRSIRKHRAFLTTSTTIENFDPDEPYQDFRRMFEDTKQMYQDSMSKVHEAREDATIFKETMHRLEQERTTHTESIIALKAENETLKYRIEAAERLNVDIRKENQVQHDELKQSHRTEIERIRVEAREQIDQLRTDHRNNIQDLKAKHDVELTQERGQKLDAINHASNQGALEKQRHQLDLETKDQEIRNIKVELERLQTDLEREKELGDSYRKQLTAAGNDATSMESAKQALQAKIAFLESDNQAQSEAYAAMQRRMNEAIDSSEEWKEKLRKEETLRRKLHNQVQELKGNIRVFCRVRPPKGDNEDELARMNFPDQEDSTDIEVRGVEKTNALGKISSEKHNFSFDRVFNTTSSNADIFNEISQLIQSALDGYNVCIFAYGQTGSGKTFTMSSNDGMIPQALRQIYSTSKELESRGWKYSMEGSFVEVYNEDIRDLLSEDEKVAKKHEVRHDMVKCETTITDVTTVDLDSQEQVESILDRAMLRRSVAATSANERSSRSHSVFILKLSGENSITGEKSKGTLNLVDLAGSERLNQSKVEGQRLKETQSINKSLSCLGDVIGALGQQQYAMPSFDGRSSLNGSNSNSTAHIPYRNSKLTYLLQFSLGGNSKTLMFVMVAPEKKCLAETLTSLKFAEKVAKTKIGVAKKVK